MNLLNNLQVESDWNHSFISQTETLANARQFWGSHKLENVSIKRMCPSTQEQKNKNKNLKGFFSYGDITEEALKLNFIQIDDRRSIKHTFINHLEIRSACSRCPVSVSILVLLISTRKVLQSKTSLTVQNSLHVFPIINCCLWVPEILSSPDRFCPSQHCWHW